MLKLTMVGTMVCLTVIIIVVYTLIGVTLVMVGLMMYLMVTVAVAYTLIMISLANEDSDVDLDLVLKKSFAWPVALYCTAHDYYNKKGSNDDKV